MIYIVVLIFLALFFINYFIARDIIAPEVIFAGVWLACSIGLAISGDSLYPISANTYLVYIMGAIIFTLGCFFCNVVMPIKNNVVAYPNYSNRPLKLILYIFFAIALIALPFYIHSLECVAKLSDPLYFLKQRWHEVHGVDLSQHQFNIFSNIAVMSIFLALVMYAERIRNFSRTRMNFFITWGSVFLALVYGSLTGTKGNAINLILMLMVLNFLFKKNVNFGKIIIYIAIVVSVFIVGIMFVNFAYLSHEGVGFLFRIFQSYFLGGLVAFDRIVQTPYVIESTQSISRFYLETANSFGFNYYVPIIHAAYTFISPNMDANTYTIYFSYFKDYGWMGVIDLMFFYGFISKFIYILAKRGNIIAGLFYSMIASGIILSFHAEHFWLALNMYIKALLFFGFCYYLAPQLLRAIKKGASTDD
jgi:oligosaccharide repeat unit polymerase